MLPITLIKDSGLKACRKRRHEKTTDTWQPLKQGMPLRAPTVSLPFVHGFHGQNPQQRMNRANLESTWLRQSLQKLRACVASHTGMCTLCETGPQLQSLGIIGHESPVILGSCGYKRVPNKISSSGSLRSPVLAGACTGKNTLKFQKQAARRAATGLWPAHRSSCFLQSSCQVLSHNFLNFCFDFPSRP